MSNRHYNFVALSLTCHLATLPGVPAGFFFHPRFCGKLQLVQMNSLSPVQKNGAPPTRRLHWKYSFSPVARSFGGVHWGRGGGGEEGGVASVRFRK